ncbi:MAG: alpha/beta fold hydrolase [Gemmatimonadetes bacterium]|nr:alpha/beta fold hydrolase [Gemmatimonadota bacterium]
MLPFHPARFRAAFWARGANAQTLLARVLRSSAVPDFVRERLETADGDFLDVDWGPDPHESAPVVVIFHGLEGSSRRRYVLSAARELLARGVRPVAVNFRGCSGEPNRTPRFYHSGETGDLTFTLVLVRQRHPGRPVGALGFSLGGNALLKLLGERDDGGRGLVDAAAAISIPFDLDRGSRLLETTRMGALYARYFLRSLRPKIRAKASLLEGVIDVQSALAARTLREFDDAATAPLHGFDDAAHYYRECSSARFVGSIGVPTVILHSRDDPFLPRDAIPTDAIRSNPHLVPAFTESGGHVGFLAGTPWHPRLWADEESARFLSGELARGTTDAAQAS